MQVRSSGQEQSSRNDAVPHRTCVINGFRLPETEREGQDGHLRDSTLSLTGGFVTNFIPFGLATTLTVAIVAFDLTTDWLTWRALLNLRIPDLVKDILGPKSREIEDSFRPFHDKRNVHTFLLFLPQVYFYFCIAATIVAGLELLRLGIMVSVQKKFVKDLIDGVHHKRTGPERLGADLILINHLLLEDCPLQLILLLLQVFIGCDFYVYLGDPIFLLSTVSALVSVLWKVCQLLMSYRQSRMDQTEQYRVGLKLLQGCSGFFLLLTLCVITVNLVILSPARQHYSKHSLQGPVMDKAAIDIWIEEESVALLLQEHEFQELTTPTIDNITQSSNPSDNSIDIARLKDIISHPNYILYIEKDISPDSWQLFALLDEELQISPNASFSNCSLNFAFRYSPFRRVIYYHGGLKCYMMQALASECFFKNFSVDSNSINSNITHGIFSAAIHDMSDAMEGAPDQVTTAAETQMNSSSALDPDTDSGKGQRFILGLAHYVPAWLKCSMLDGFQIDSGLSLNMCWLS